MNLIPDEAPPRLSPKFLVFLVVSLLIFGLGVYLGYLALHSFWFFLTASAPPLNSGRLTYLIETVVGLTNSFLAVGVGYLVYRIALYHRTTEGFSFYLRITTLNLVRFFLQFFVIPGGILIVFGVYRLVVDNVFLWSAIWIVGGALFILGAIGGSILLRLIASKVYHWNIESPFQHRRQNGSES